MNGEIICVGTELLLGDIVNTNAQFLSTELAKLGINIYNQSVVGDNEQRIKQELFTALKRSNLIIFTGGLGPTQDDLTKESIAAFFSLPLIEDSDSRAHIEEYFRRTGRNAVKSNFKQALTPKGAHIFKNDVGTAPGYAIKNGESTVIILPGPPQEMEHMFTNYVRPYLMQLTHETIVSHNIHIFGEMESKIEEKISQFTKLSNPTTAPYAKEGEVNLRVTAKAQSAAVADNLCTPVINAIKEVLGDCVYGVDCESLQHLVVEKLKEKKMKIATAESCTAGLLSSMITEVPGSSAVFDFGVSAYANRIKEEALGVPKEIIEKYGAVSEHTAAYMAMGVRKLANADLGIGITGVAGPGASEHKPVGLVYIALADKEHVWIRRATLGHGSDEREKVRRNSAKTALDLVRRYLCSLPFIMDGGFKIGDVPVVLDAQPAIASNIKAEPIIREHRENHFIPDSEIADIIGAVAASEYTAENYTATAQSSDDGFLAEIIENDDEDNGILGRLVGKHPQADDLVESNGLITESDELINISETEERESKFMKFLRSFLPWKGDKIGEVLRKLLFTLSFIALIVCSIYMVMYFHEGSTQNAVIEQTREIYDKYNVEKNDAGRYVSFEELLKQNPDTAAWITIPNTQVDNPVVICGNNDYYLNHNFLKQKSRYGALYFDSSSKISADEISQNLVIYGHEMRDGSMFGTLKRYKNVNFYKENPVFSMRTLYTNEKYKIFAVMITNASPEQDNGYVFEYRYPEFSSQEQFLEWIDAVKERSIINTGIDIQENDKIVTLSTCTSEFENARLVIMARMIREGENSTIEQSAVSVNPYPHYPQAYYDKKNLNNPYADANSDTSSTDTSSEESSSQDSSSSNDSSEESSSGRPNSSRRPSASQGNSSRPSSSSKNSSTASTPSTGGNDTTPQDPEPTPDPEGGGASESTPDPEGGESSEPTPTPDPEGGDTSEPTPDPEGGESSEPTPDPEGGESSEPTPDPEGGDPNPEQPTDSSTPAE